MYSNVETKHLETLMEKCLGKKKYSHDIWNFGNILKCCKNTHVRQTIQDDMTLYLKWDFLM